MTQPRILFVIILLTLGAGISARRWFVQPREGAGSGSSLPICSASSEPGASCRLPEAGYPLTIGGVPSAAVSVAFFAAVAIALVLALLGSAALQHRITTIAFRLVAVAVAVDLVLLVLQIAVWRNLCTLCLATYGATLVAAVLLFRPLGTAPAATEPGETRMFMGGWLLATAGLLVAIAGGELWQRQQARVSQLQLTLDDSGRREQYLEDRAVVRFQQAPVVSFDLQGAPRFGAPDAPITVIEFIDYQCPICRQLSGYLDEYLAGTHGRVSWYFKNLPLDRECNPTLPENYHPGACWMARGAVCAHQAGKFVEFYRASFAAERANPGLADVTKLGAGIGLDRTRYAACVTSPRTVEAVARDVADALRSQAQGTPTLFINGRRAPLWTYLERLVAVEEARSGVAKADSAR